MSAFASFSALLQLQLSYYQESWGCIRTGDFVHAIAQRCPALEQIVLKPFAMDHHETTYVIRQGQDGRVSVLQ